MGRNAGKNMSKKLSVTFTQKRSDHVKHSVTDSLKTASKRATHKTAEATGDLIDNKIVGRSLKDVATE